MNLVHLKESVWTAKHLSESKTYGRERELRQPSLRAKNSKMLPIDLIFVEFVP